MSDSNLNTGLPAFDTDEDVYTEEGVNDGALPASFNDERQPAEILQITFAENEDDDTLTDVFFAGENFDADDEDQVYAALLFAIRTIQPDKDEVYAHLATLEEMDEQN